MFKKMKSWVSKQWKILAGFFALAAAAAAMYFRSKGQKKILEYANKSHKEENLANEKALKDLTDGLTKISEEKEKKLSDLQKNHEKSSDDLEKRKKDFIDESSKDENLDDLAKNLADEIGADFVE